MKLLASALETAGAGPVAWRGSGGDYYYQLAQAPYRALEELSRSANTGAEMVSRALGWFTARRLEGLQSPLTLVLPEPLGPREMDTLTLVAHREIDVLLVLLEERKEISVSWNPLRRESSDGNEELCRRLGAKFLGSCELKKPERLRKELEQAYRDSGFRVLSLKPEADPEFPSDEMEAVARPLRPMSGEDEATVEIERQESIFERVVESLGREYQDSSEEIVFWAGRQLPRCLDSLGERLWSCPLDGVLEQAIGVSMAGRYPILIVPSTAVAHLLPELYEYGSFPCSILVCDGGLSPLRDRDGEYYYHPSSLRDLALLRPLPGVVVTTPADELQALELLRVARSHPGMVVLRFTAAPPVGLTAAEEITFGEGRCLRRGDRAAILAIGSTVFPSVLAAESLKAWGVEAAVYDMRFVAPLDEELLKEAAATGVILTVEEHLVSGGFGAAVLERIAALGLDPVKVRCLGVGEGEHPVQLAAPLEAFGLDAHSIAQALREQLGLSAPGEF